MKFYKKGDKISPWGKKIEEFVSDRKRKLAAEKRPLNHVIETPRLEAEIEGKAVSEKEKREGGKPAI